MMNLDQSKRGIESRAIKKRERVGDRNPRDLNSIYGKRADGQFQFSQRAFPNKCLIQTGRLAAVVVPERVLQGNRDGKGFTRGRAAASSLFVQG
jgi:hypothetical protein